MEEKIITIQQTSKKWKKVYLVSFLTITLGFMALLIGASLNNGLITMLGVLLIIVSIVGFVVAKVGAWWTNR
jgi:hypothetical protein